VRSPNSAGASRIPTGNIAPSCLSTQGAASPKPVGGAPAELFAASGRKLFLYRPPPAWLPLDLPNQALTVTIS
jgi:hypothetical protein